MPRHPELSERCHGLPPQTFARFADRLALERKAGTLIPLHLGDTYLPPDPALTALDLGQVELHRYAPVAGIPELRRRIATDVAPAMGLEAEAEDVCFAVGATGGLDLVFSSLCDPGDEVIVVTPTWPLVLGIVPSNDGAVVQVPIDASGWPADDPGPFEQRLQAAVTPRTIAVYVCDPNNPCGFVYPEAYRQAIGRVVTRHKLRLVVDAVYAQLHWSGQSVSWSHVVPREQLLAVGSFSKTHGLSGHRAGFVIAPPSMRGVMERTITFSVYQSATVAMHLTLRALDLPAARERILESYRDGARRTVASLQARFREPQAGAFVFVDLRDDPRGPDAIMSACLDEHVALAPGAASGRGFESFVRLCYTTVPTETLERGLAAVSAVLRR
jgi:aspartate/methionine/tyrosine aminotransferase